MLIADTKRCLICGEVKSKAEFSLDIRSRDGLYARCKDCWRQYLANRHMPIQERELAGLQALIQAEFKKHKLLYWWYLVELLPINDLRHRKALGQVLKALGAVREKGDDLAWYLPTVRKADLPTK